MEKAWNDARAASPIWWSQFVTGMLALSFGAAAAAWRMEIGVFVFVVGLSGTYVFPVILLGRANPERAAGIRTVYVRAIRLQACLFVIFMLIAMYSLVIQPIEFASTLGWALCGLLTAVVLYSHYRAFQS